MVSVRFTSRVVADNPAAVEVVCASVKRDLRDVIPQVPHAAEVAVGQLAELGQDHGRSASFCRGGQECRSVGSSGAEGVLDEVGDLDASHGFHEIRLYPYVRVDGNRPWKFAPLSAIGGDGP
jgi:hypothetical protein